ncbi:MAG: hypothetical protein ABR955_11545 [Verrucomicrobiota bacterium]
MARWRTKPIGGRGATKALLCATNGIGDASKTASPIVGLISFMDFQSLNAKARATRQHKLHIL